MQKGKMRTGLILKLLGLFCVLLFAAGVLIYGLMTGFGFPDLLPVRPETEPENTYSYEETPKSLREVRIDWVDGPVTVLFHNRETIEVTEKSHKELHEDEKLLMELSGGELSIRWNSSLLNVSLFRDTPKTLEVKLPAQFKEKLEKVQVYTVSGDVTLADLDALEIDAETVSGALSLQNMDAESFRVCSVSGDIHCADVSGTGKFRVHTTSGAVQLTQITAGETKVDTTSGAVVLTGGADTLECITVSGPVSCTLDRWPEKLEGESVSGDLSLALPESEAGFLMKFDTVSGRLTCDFETQIRDKLYLNGEGAAEVKLSTTSGNAALTRVTE